VCVILIPSREESDWLWCAGFWEMHSRIIVVFDDLIRATNYLDAEDARHHLTDIGCISLGRLFLFGER
jgi:hypothetical protein